MIYNVLLISEDKLKSNTPINENVDTQELRFSIQQAQQIFIQESLGTNLYEYILLLVSTGDIDDPSKIHYKTTLKKQSPPLFTNFMNDSSKINLRVVNNLSNTLFLQT